MKKRIILLLLAFVMMLCCCSCKTTVKVKDNTPKTKSSSVCGTLTIDGELKNSGSIKVSGKICLVDGGTYNFIQPVSYKYTRNGSNVTLTASSLKTTLRKIEGTYNSSSNTFTIKKVYFA